MLFQTGKKPAGHFTAGPGILKYGKDKIMKITDIRAYVLTTEFTTEWPVTDRQATPLDYYEEYGGVPITYSQSPHLKPEKGLTKNIMLEILTDEGVSGIHLPVNQHMQAEGALSVYRPLLIGMDPFAIRTIRDKMDRFAQYGRTGSLMTSISAIDNALWDLKGKAVGLPVYRLLGGARNKLQPYVSTLGCNADDMSLVREWAKKVSDMGVWGQKWFLKYGPSSGYEGMKKNIELVYTVREAAGEGAKIMFDAWASWDLSYCLEIFPELEAAKPFWIEEPLRTDRIEAYGMLKDKSNIQISFGEKLVNRFELHAFLKAGVIDVYQPEPEMFGGVTESVIAGEMCELYGVKYLLHGMSLMPIMSVSSAMAPDITPCFEYLMRTVPGFVSPLKDPPPIVDGYVTLDDRPGMFHLDEEKIVSREEITL